MGDTNNSEQENPLQKVVDKVKTINLVGNAHNLTPPQQQIDRSGDIMIVEVLKSEPRLAEIYLQIRGEIVDSKNKIIQVSQPIMNNQGAILLMNMLKNISRETEWATFGEEEIGPRVIWHYSEIVPRFTLDCQRYELNPADFHYLHTTVLSFIDSSFHKAKNGYYGNIIKRTYSEDLLGKAVKNEEAKTKQTFMQKMGII